MGMPEQPAKEKRKLFKYKCRKCCKEFKDWYLPEDKRICTECLNSENINT